MLNLNDNLLQVINFLEDQSKDNENLKFFEINENLDDFFKRSGIGVKLEEYKEIVLKEELGLELGGMEKTSFSLIYPTNEKLDDDRDFIYLLGNETDEVNSNAIHFGIFILIQSNNLEDKLFDDLRHFSLISNSIEGFSTRSIPTRFWCRITENVLKKGFSFEILGKAIVYLYKKRFGETLNSIKIFIINSDEELLKLFLKLISNLKSKINKHWIDKINDWKKRLDCDYSWTCEICPFLSACQNIQEILQKRKEIK
ncbi:MAG: hypothetical protein GF317_03215 [Candidatus Lokiarchaeota archaeon]|nr:hypothetical protein [Candidatus Lokiarchaeota archaeon]MBD3198918.1 hypothetical protein [Candidatus Lokiarchaeota archaeon]